MKKTNQSGFGVVEVILILVIVAILGFVGWYVWEYSSIASNSNGSSTQLTTSKKNYVDTAKQFSFQYPSDWGVENIPEGGHDGYVSKSDYNKVSRPVYLIPPNWPKASEDWALPTVTVIDRKELESRMAESQEDKMHTISPFNVGDLPATLDKLDFVGPSAAEKYTDFDYYVVLKSAGAGLVLVLSYREAYSNKTVVPAVSWSDSQDLSAFQAIVNSVQFVRS